MANLPNPPQPANPVLTLDGQNGIAFHNATNPVPSTPTNMTKAEKFMNYKELIKFLSTNVTVPGVDPSRLAIVTNPPLVYPDFQKAIFPPTPPSRIPSSGKVALVVGGSRNLGKVISIFLQSQGYTVIATSRDPASYYGPNRNPLLSNIPLDIRQQNSVDNFFKRVIKPIGRLDFLILCAGVHTYSPLPGASADYLSNVFELKVYGFPRMCTAAIPYLRQNPDSRVLAFSSIGGCEMFGQPMFGGYQVSNHMVSHIMKQMNVDERTLHAFNKITNPITYITIAPVLVLSTIGLFDYFKDAKNQTYANLADMGHIILASAQSGLTDGVGYPASSVNAVGQQIYDIISAPQPGVKYFLGDTDNTIGGVPIGQIIANTNLISDVDFYNAGIAPSIPLLYNEAAINALRQGLLSIYAPP